MRYWLYALKIPSVILQTAESVYDRIKDKASNDYNEAFDTLNSTETGDVNMDFVDKILRWIWNAFDGLYDIFKGIFPLAFSTPIIIGILILLIIRKNKAIQKFAIFGLIIGMPVVLLIIIYLVPYLKGIFGVT